MNSSIDIYERKVGEFSSRILQPLSDLSRECIQYVWEALSNGVKVALADFCKFAGGACCQVGCASLLTEEAHLPKKLAWVEVAHHHFLIRGLAIINDDRD